MNRNRPGEGARGKHKLEKRPRGIAGRGGKSATRSSLYQEEGSEKGSEKKEADGGLAG